MDVKQLLGAITAMIAKIAIAAAVIVVVFKLAVGAYDFGFQVFADIPKDEGDGRTVSVTVSEGQNSKDVGKLLENKGLIDNATVFYVQEALNTAMSVEEMLETMCAADEAETEEGN